MFQKSTRLTAISFLISLLGGTFKGHRKLQILVYLANEIGFNTGHTFQYDHFSVWSKLLEEDLIHSSDYILVSDTLYAPRSSLESLENASLGQQTTVFISQHPPRNVKISISEEMIVILNRLFEMKTPTLDYLSTIVYLRSLGIEGSVLEIKVKEIKYFISWEHSTIAWSFYDKVLRPLIQNSVDDPPHFPKKDGVYE